MKEYLNFRDNKQSKTDDFLYKTAALNDTISTIGGIFIALVSALIPVLIAFSSASQTVKLGAFGTVPFGGGAGAAITHYNPNRKAEQETKTEEGEQF